MDTAGEVINPIVTDISCKDCSIDNFSPLDLEGYKKGILNNLSKMVKVEPKEKPVQYKQRFKLEVVQ